MATRDDIESYLALIALKDREAFDLLYDATSSKLYGVCVRVLGDRAAAEDALHDVYLKIWERAGSYRVNGLSPMTWLITVARNHSIDRLRARRAVSGRSVDARVLEPLSDEAPGPEADAIAAQVRRHLYDCLSQLEPDRAEAVQRAYIYGDTYADLASRYDVPLNTMRTWLRRALISLRACMTP